MTFRPLGDRVWITPQAPIEQTASGLHLVEHRKPEQVGTIAEIGEKVRTVQVGNQVIFPWAAGYEIVVNDGERYLLMRECDLLAVIETEEVPAHA